MAIYLKRLKIRSSSLAGMPSGTVPRECLKNYFRKGAWPSSRGPINCMALSANSYKMVEATPYRLQKSDGDARLDEDPRLSDKSLMFKLGSLLCRIFDLILTCIQNSNQHQQ